MHGRLPRRLARIQPWKRITIDGWRLNTHPPEPIAGVDRLARDFEQALATLEALGNDGPAHVLADRCQALRVAAPPSDRDGTFAAREK
jgi:hypothetical protein